MNAADRAAELVSWWVATYTRRLPATVAERRQAEVASDVWEQRAYGRGAAAPVALSILRRMVAGMAADLGWRRGQLAAARAGRQPEPRARPVLTALARNWWLVVAALVGMAEVVAGVRMALAGDNPVIGTGATATTGTSTGSGVVTAGAGLLMLLGIAWRRRSPITGNALIGAGAIPMVTVLPWIVTIGTLLVIFQLTQAGRVRGLGAPARSGHRVAVTLTAEVAGVLILYHLLWRPAPAALAAGLLLLGLLLVYGAVRWRRRAT
jgi:MYXO-CTERM domain-containing protein